MCGGARVDEEDFLFLLFRHSFTLPTIFKKGASGIEPPSSRSAIECSTTELRCLKTITLIFQNVLFKTSSFLCL